MFTWICPKCGGEVPPSRDECPRCAAQAAAAAAPAQPAAPPAGPAAAVPPPQPPPAPAYAPPVAPPPPSGTLFGQPAAAPPPPPVHAQPAPPPEQSPSPYPPPPRQGLSPALVAILAMLGISGLLAVLFLWVLPKRSADDQAATKAPVEAAAPQSRHPLAKHIEVVGVRIVEAGRGAAKIQLLVVNHSAADLPEMKMDVTIRSADKDFFTFPVGLPSIGPYESKELSATVKTELKPYELPDWQTIRPQFVLTSEP